MQKLRNFLTQPERIRDDRGSSLIETVITIPLIALIAGMMAFGIAKSLIVMNQNNMAVVAGTETQNAMNALQDTKSCYDLEKALSDTNLFPVEGSRGFKITPAVTECGIDTSVTINLKAVRMSNSKVIFDTTAKHFIPRA